MLTVGEGLVLYESILSNEKRLSNPKEQFRTFLDLKDNKWRSVNGELHDSPEDLTLPEECERKSFADMQIYPLLQARGQK